MHRLLEPAAATLAASRVIRALVLAARRRSWPLPGRPARLTGTAPAAAEAALAAAGARRFGSMSPRSGVELGVLATCGLYRRTRNPQYRSFVAMIAGIGLVTRSGLTCALAAAAWVHFTRWIPTEERRLGRVFGGEYRAYAA